MKKIVVFSLALLVSASAFAAAPQDHQDHHGRHHGHHRHHHRNHEDHSH